MFPGYGDLPYASPIFVRAVKPAGGRKLILHYRDAGYAQGAQERDGERMRVLSRGDQHVAVRREGDEERIAILVPITAGWLKGFAAEFAKGMRDGESAVTFLDRELGERNAPEDS